MQELKQNSRNFYSYVIGIKLLIEDYKTGKLAYVKAKNTIDCFSRYLNLYETFMQHVLNTYSTNNAALAFRKAAAEGNLDDVKRILHFISDINGPGADSKKTALHQAAKNKHQVVVEFLLKQGANPELLDSDGKKAADYNSSPNSVPKSPLPKPAKPHATNIS